MPARGKHPTGAFSYSNRCPEINAGKTKHPTGRICGTDGCFFRILVLLGHPTGRICGPAGCLFQDPFCIRASDEVWFMPHGMPGIEYGRGISIRLELFPAQTDARK